MDDFVGVDGVISAQRLAVLSERTNGPGLIYLVSHWGAIGATGTMMALTWGTWWSVPLFAIQGVLINFLYAPEHECAHYTAFRTRWLNKWVSWVCGFLIFLPSEFHRWTHYAHHRHTQDWEKDTELARPEFVSAWQYLGHLSGVPFVLLRFRNLVSHALGRCTESFLTEPQRRAVIQVARWHVVGYLVVATSAIVMQSWWPIYYWIGPLVLMRWSYFIEGFAEHTGLNHGSNTLLNTRTLKTSIVVRWLNWNMTYHTVHHTFPAVPFPRLAALHREVEKQIGFELPSSSYFSFHWLLVKQLAGGKSEIEICAQDENDQIAADRLAPPNPLPLR